MAGINVDWLPGYDKPSPNTWYRCKLRNDWYKIVKEGRNQANSVTLYKIVSFREWKDVFFGLTMAQARSAIQIETVKIYNYGG